MSINDGRWNRGPFESQEDYSMSKGDIESIANETLLLQAIEEVKSQLRQAPHGKLTTLENEVRDLYSRVNAFASLGSRVQALEQSNFAKKEIEYTWATTEQLKEIHEFINYNVGGSFPERFDEFLRDRGIIK
jgi:hypothetical protein